MRMIPLLLMNLMVLRLIIYTYYIVFMRWKVNGGIGVFRFE